MHDLVLMTLVHLIKHLRCHTYSCFPSHVAHTLLAAGVADVEGFHGIDFFVSFTNLLLGFHLVEFSGISRVLLVLVLMDAPKWWSDKQQNQE